MKITDLKEKFDYLFNNSETLINDRLTYEFLVPLIQKAEVHRHCKTASSKKELLFEEITGSLTKSFLSAEKAFLIFKGFVLENDKAVMTHAFRLAERASSVLIQHFDHFQNIEEAQRFDLALFLINKEPYLALSHLQSFNQLSSSHWCALAEKLIEKTGSEAMRRLFQFLGGMEEKDHRFALFVHLLRKIPEKISHQLRSSYFQEFDFVKQAVQEDASFSKYLPQCNLKQEEWFTIASIIAEKDPYLAAKTNFNLSIDQELPFSLFLSSLLYHYKEQYLFIDFSGNFSPSIFDNLARFYDPFYISRRGVLGHYLNNPEHPALLEHPYFKEAIKRAKTISNPEERQKQLDWIKGVYLAYWILKENSDLNPDNAISFILENPCLHRTKSPFQALKHLQKAQAEFNPTSLPENYFFLYLQGKSLFESRKKQNQWLDTLKRHNNLSKEEIESIISIISNIQVTFSNTKHVIKFLTHDLFHPEVYHSKEIKKTFDTFCGILSCESDVALFQPLDYSEERTRFEKAKSLALTKPREFIKNIRSFHLNEELKKELISILIKTDLRSLETNFGNFEFKEKSISSSFVLSVLDQAYKNHGSLVDFVRRLRSQSGITFLKEAPLDPWMEALIENYYEENFPFYFALETAAPEQKQLLKQKQFHLKLMLHFHTEPFIKEINIQTASIKSFLDLHNNLLHEFWFSELLTSKPNSSSSFNSLFEKAEKITHAFAKQNKLNLLTKVRSIYELLTLLYGESHPRIETFFQKLESAVPTQNLREPLSYFLLKMAVDRKQWEILKSYPEKFNIKMIVPYFIGYSLVSDCAHPEQFLALWSGHLRKCTSELIPGKNMGLLLNFLLKLQASPLDSQIKRTLLENQLLHGDKSEALERIRLCTTLLVSNQPHFSIDSMSLAQLKERVANSFFAVFQITPSLEEKSLFEQAFIDRVQTLRDPNALISFALNLASEPFSASALPALNCCVRELLQGSFHEGRYQTPHLDLLRQQEVVLENGERVKKHEKLLQQWKQGDSRPLYKPFREKFALFLKKLLIENNSFPDLNPRLSWLNQFLQGKLDLTEAIASAKDDPFQVRLLQLCEKKASLKDLTSLLEVEAEADLTKFKASLQEWERKQHKKNKTQPFSEKFKSFLIQKLITDGHISNFKEKMPLLHAFLTDTKTLENALALCAQEPSAEKELLVLCTKNTNQRVTPLLNLFKEEPQFSFDLKEFQQTLFSFIPPSYEGWKIVDTDDLSHLLLMGRETGGCLNIDTGVNKRAAVANLADGKIRLLAALNPHNEIVGRAILRLLLNDNNEPVLLLERYYSLSGDDNLPDAILKYAIKRARSLNVPLVSNHFNSDTPFNHSIHSRGSKAPFEYTDVSLGMTNGIYSLEEGLFLLYDPTQTY